MADAGKACKIKPNFAKAYYRMTLGHSMVRDSQRAKKDVREGLKECHENGALKIVLDELTDLGVPDHIINPFSGVNKEANRKVESGAPSETCTYGCKIVPLPLEGNCPLFSMSLETDVEEQALIDFLLNH